MKIKEIFTPEAADALPFLHELGEEEVTPVTLLFILGAENISEDPATINPKEAVTLLNIQLKHWWEESTNFEQEFRAAVKQAHAA